MSALNPAYEEFRAGVTAVLRSWSAFRVAVESGWGGVESLKKAEDLRTNLFEHFNGISCPPKSMTQEDLEDSLAIYMEEELSVVLEDGSERQVADTIWTMYESCYKGDVSLARQMVAAAEQAVILAALHPSQMQSEEEEDDDDDDDMVDDAEVPTLMPQNQTPSLPSASQYSSQFLFGAIMMQKAFVPLEPPRQLGESLPPPEPKIEVDEDGFAPVATGRRKAR
jgi:pre-rRNA-processing protein TSR2